MYREKQNFLTWWLSLLLVLIFLSGVYMGWVNMGADAGTDKASDFLNGGGWGLAVTGLVCLLLFTTQLRTRIDAEGIHARFFPYMPKEKSWRWEDIAEVYVRRYSFWDYGGWGYRMGSAGTAYNTKGWHGIQLVLKKGGRRVLIGTQRPEEVQKILVHFWPKTE